MWFLVVLLLAVPPGGIAGRGAYFLPFGADDKACSVRGSTVLQQPGVVVAECVLGEVQAHQVIQEWLSGKIPWPPAP